MRQLPKTLDVVNLIREHYGLSMQEVLDVIHTPLHPRELRDEFAMQALNGIMACFHEFKGAGDKASRCRLAYAYADAMLEARAKKGD